MLSKASFIIEGCYARQWLDNVDMHLYANFDQNIPCGSRVMIIFTNCERSHTVIIYIVHTFGSCNMVSDPTL